MKTKIRIIRLSDDQLNDINGGVSYLSPKPCSQIIKKEATRIKETAHARFALKPKGNKTFTKGNLIGFCEDCHIFVYEYNLSLHQNHNVICAGGR